MSPANRSTSGSGWKDAGGYAVPDMFADEVVISSAAQGPMVKPTRVPSVKPTLRGRIRLRWLGFRERLGFAIAGYMPEDD